MENKDTEHRNTEYISTEDKNHVVELLARSLTLLGEVTVTMLRLYEKYPWLNDEVDISSVIPMSLDEWHLEINTKIEELAFWHKRGES